MRPITSLLLWMLLALPARPSLAATDTATIVAHRGLAEGIPENTLAAFRQSVERGIAVIELDLRSTKDGHLVILHDETLDRTTDCSGRIASLTLAKVKSCDAGWPTHNGERVPTLAEALTFIQSGPARLLIDVKPGTSLDRVLAEVRNHRAESNVILGLRRSMDVAKVRSAAPSIPLLAFMPNASDAPEFAHAGAGFIRLWSDWVEEDPSLVERTRSLGAQPWIMVGRRLPSRESEWRKLHARMLAMRPQGLITDRPELISPAP